MAPKILKETLTDEVADRQLGRFYANPETPTLILLRNLQGQLDALADRIAALEAP